MAAAGSESSAKHQASICHCKAIRERRKRESTSRDRPWQVDPHTNRCTRCTQGHRETHPEGRRSAKSFRRCSGVHGGGDEPRRIEAASPFYQALHEIQAFITQRGLVANGPENDRGPIAVAASKAIPAARTWRLADSFMSLSLCRVGNPDFTAGPREHQPRYPRLECQSVPTP
jgi:hypothetical protein